MESRSLLFSFLLALLVSLLAFGFAGLLPYFFPSLSPSLISLATLIGIPLAAYFLGILFSVMNSYNMCKKVEMKQHFISQLFIALTTFIVSFVLFIENLPIYKYIFGSYPPPETETDMSSEKHYKIQFFSGIVKAVLPTHIDESIQSGFVAMYWNFFATLLPSFFLLKMQSC